MFDKDVYIHRRKNLHEGIADGILLFIGNGEVPMNYTSNTYRWRQDSNFLYFFGLDYPNMAAIVDTESGDEYLFGNDVSLDGIIWMGPQITTSEKAIQCGVDKSLPFKDLFEMVQKAVVSGRKIHFLPPYRAENKLLLEHLTGFKAAEMKEKASEAFIRQVVKLRSVKEPREIIEIEKAIDTGWMMHTTAMRMTLPGNYEREIAAAIEGIALSTGGMLSFPAIVSIHGETLHNHYHGNQLKKNDLLLVDAGAESPMHYASDHTRTIPVGGKFTSRQRDIYQAVLDALNTAILAVKPGSSNLDSHMLACRVLASRLKDLGLMKGDIDTAVEQGAHALFFPHGLGHMMGLDVHDMEDLGENYVGYDEHVSRSSTFGLAFLRLARDYQPGFVLTVEPGCYFIPALIDKWHQEGRFKDYINYDKVNEYRNFGGIRIEDDIMVTNTGFRNLGKPIPKNIEEVEELCGNLKL